MLQMMQDSVNQQSVTQCYSREKSMINGNDAENCFSKEVYGRKNVPASKMYRHLKQVCEKIAASRKKGPKVIERSHRTFKASVGAAH